MKEKRFLKLLLILTMVVFVIAGCSKERPDSNDPTKDTTDTTDTADGTEENDRLKYDGITLSVVLAQGWDTPGREALFDKFTEETGVKFDMQFLPDDMAGELIKTKFATNELPDIIFNSGSVLEHSYMIPEEKLVDLSDEPWIDQLMSKESFMVDDKIWGVPMGGQGFFAFAVNTKVFEENDLKIPNSKAELEAAFEVLKENGIQPFYLGAKDPWLVGNITSGAIQKELEKDPGLIEKLNKNEVKYADIPGMIEVFDDLRRWNELGYLGDNTMADSWDAHYQVFAEGKAGVTVGLTTWDVTIEEKFPGATEHIDMIPFYIGDSDTFFAGTSAQWYIPNSGKHIDVVKDFFRFVTSQENLNEFYGAMGEASTPWKDVKVQSLKPTEIIIDKLNSGEYKYHFGHNQLVQAQDFDGLCKQAQEVLIGSKTAQEAVEEYDQMRAQIAKALGLEGF